MSCPLSCSCLWGDPTDPGLKHSCGNLYGAALGEYCCSALLSFALVDWLQLWNHRGLWPAELWFVPKRLAGTAGKLKSFWQGESFFICFAFATSAVFAGIFTNSSNNDLPDELVIEESASENLHVFEDAEDLHR
ncbi:hypothetical protein PMIT1313_00083 [Prochlorococcus marinus str. MIT 1313]|nr:hypothetical protein PMIT1313_00083 [Prochlorococcus marinus str. MIT 1313]